MRIGHLSTFYHTAMLFLACPELVGEHADPIDWRLFGTGPAIIEAFGRGELDLAYVGLPPAIVGIAQGIPIRCIAGGHVEGTVLVGKERFTAFPEAGTPAAIFDQLKGCTIGVPGRGSIHDVILAFFLEGHPQAGEISVRRFSWADRIVESFAREEVEAAIGTPALAVALARYARGKVLLPPWRVWPSNPSYGIVADLAYLGRERAKVLSFLAAHEHATALLRNSPREAARIISGHVGFVDEDFVFDTLGLSPHYCAQLTDRYIESTADFVKVMVRLGYISRDVPTDEIFQSSLIREIHPGEDHYGMGASRRAGCSS